MKRKANVPTWIFGIILVYVLILIFSVYFGETIITNSDELIEMYDANPTMSDSLDLLFRISTFQLTNVVPLWISLFINTMTIIVILSIVMIIRGIS